MPFGKYRRPPVANKAPLRKIIERGTVDAGYWTGEYTGVEVDAEKLECGHIIKPRKDFVGETNAERRRCRLCEKEQAKEGKGDG